MRWQAWTDLDGTLHFEAKLTERDQREMSRESREMFEDALWLARHALRGSATTGLLALPQTGIPIRTA